MLQLFTAPHPTASQCFVTVIYPKIPTLQNRIRDFFPKYAAALSGSHSADESIESGTKKDFAAKIPAAVALACLPDSHYKNITVMGPLWGGWTSCAPPTPLRAPPIMPLDPSGPTDHYSYALGGLEQDLCLPPFALLAALFSLPWKVMSVEEFVLKGLSGPLRSRVLDAWATEDFKAAYVKKASVKASVTLEVVPDFAKLVEGYRFSRLLNPMTPLGLWSVPFRIHQVLTIEFVDALAAYLSARVALYRVNDPSADTCPVVEVGAGFGVLSNALRSRGLKIIATSTNDDWPMDYKDNKRLRPQGVVEERQEVTLRRV